MTDQTIPADLTPEEAKAAREWATDYLKSGAGSERVRAAARVVLATVPAPPRPTLADMTVEERAACRWMQADIIGGDEPLVITRIDRGDGAALILDRNGRSDWSFAEDVTPRPDLPRMTWPGTEKDDPAPALPDGWRLADHREYGRGIVTNPTLTRAGRVYFVVPADDPMGYDWFSCSTDELTYLDQEDDQ